MGIPGSKEDLEQLVAIYGYNTREFGWKDIDHRSMSYASGIIITCNDKKYILTTRDRLIYCQDIVMYHSCYRKEEPIFRHNMDIIFQSIEHNIAILVTKGCLELDLTKGEMVNNEINPKTLTNGYPILNDYYPLPTKKSNLYVVKSEIDFEPDIIFKTQIYDVQFMKSIVDEYKYLPRTLMYLFSINLKENQDYSRLNGSVIINKKHRVIGLVSRSDSRYLYVIPMKIVKKIINDFIYFENQIETYSYPITLPFGYYVRDHDALIHQKYIINTVNGKKHLKANDKLVSISNCDILIKRNDIHIYDRELKMAIPFDIYLNINYRMGDQVDMVIERNEKKINMAIYTIASSMIPKISIHDKYFPSYSTPYVNINGIIIVELTHELMELMAIKKIVLQNYLMDNWMHGELDDKNMLIIIDCLNIELALEYKLPRISSHKKQKIKAPLIFDINGITVSTLADVLKYHDCSHHLQIKFGLQKDAPYLINL